MRYSTHRPTKAEQERFRKLIQLGCVACRKAGSGYSYPEIHHILSGGRRMGHMQSIPLCFAHHRIPNNGTVIGPSLADGSRLFAAKFGSQMELLAEVNHMVGKAE